MSLKKGVSSGTVMFRVMFLSRRESQRPTFVDTRAQFSSSVPKQSDVSHFAFFEKSPNCSHNSCEMTLE